MTFGLKGPLTGLTNTTEDDRQIDKQKEMNFGDYGLRLQAATCQVRARPFDDVGIDVEMNAV